MTSEANRDADVRSPGERPDDANERPTREYHADGITVQWFARRCIHSGNCVRALPGVFDFRRRPWIDIEADNADSIERAVRGCPSGALQCVRHDDQSPRQDSSEPRL